METPPAGSRASNMVFLGAEVLVLLLFVPPVPVAVIPPVLKFVVMGVFFALVVGAPVSAAGAVVLASCRATKASISGRNLGHARQADTAGESDSTKTASWPSDRVALIMAAR